MIHIHCAQILNKYRVVRLTSAVQTPTVCVYLYLSVMVGCSSTENIPAVLRVSPHSWPSEGDLVTLKCSINDSSTAWKFHWYKIVPYTGHIPVIQYHHRFYCVELLSDRSTEGEGSYTIGPVALNHTGFYVCRAEGAGPIHYSDFSEVGHVWVTGELGCIYDSV